MITRFKIFESKGEPVDRATALSICQELSDILGLRLIQYIGPDTEGEPNCAYIGGSLRRGEAVVNDIDLLITKELKAVDLTKITGLSLDKVGSKQIFIIYKGVSLNFWILTDLSQFGSFIFHITGPKGYNIGIRMLASKLGLKINQYGIFKNDVLIPNSNETEGNFYKTLKYAKYPQGKPWKDPKLRGKK